MTVYCKQEALAISTLAIFSVTITTPSASCPSSARSHKLPRMTMHESNASPTLHLPPSMDQQGQIASQSTSHPQLTGAHATPSQKASCPPHHLSRRHGHPDAGTRLAGRTGAARRRRRAHTKSTLSTENTRSPLSLCKMEGGPRRDLLRTVGRWER